ncbi:5-guanidino-2-oxopentanoate decarboxylase [Pseudohalocynthiibacter aestuariivivens]|nr:5-guanidino-2-oxopentanoate decarboxylase [Pseudohalocynthiibacter aestuariivivens]QIE45995.1 5-guanidino-2-oxopentanoate decarboxylase [Pseudohalocynthiibacter aestuariivivens]
MTTCGEKLVELLEAYGVDHAFGIPGTHTIELYRGLGSSNMRHISPRHEQGCGFMADGYARATGKPAVCFTISGPGAFNIMTPMAQALQDSIPMLVISADNPTRSVGLASGLLHEVDDLAQAMSHCSRWSQRVTDPAILPQLIARAFATFHSGRPGPVHITLPLDVITAAADTLDTQPWPMPGKAAPDPAMLATALKRIASAKAPVIALGGGAIPAADLIAELVERVDAPTTLTQNAKGLLRGDHPLLVRGSPAFDEVRQLYDHADLVLAIGTEFGQTDYDYFFNGRFAIDRDKVVRIDNALPQLTGNVPASCSILSDSRLAVEALLAGLTVAERDGKARTAAMNARLQGVDDSRYDRFFACLSDALGDYVMVGDSTQPAYFASAQFHPDSPRSFYCAATGFGTLGYALPAAMGARLGDDSRPIVAVMGDGGIQYTLTELSASTEYGIPVIVIVWNNRSYDMIAQGFNDAGMKPIACDPHHPDFMRLAEAYDCDGRTANSVEELRKALEEARDKDRSCLIEIDETRFFSGC